jgi:hypothetical protein
MDIFNIILPKDMAETYLSEMTAANLFTIVVFGSLWAKVFLTFFCFCFDFLPNKIIKKIEKNDAEQSANQS